VTGSIVSGAGHRGDLDLDCDVVVVGSGAGGATVATELALAGKRVIVLEEGREIPAAEHGAMRQSESLRHVWREGGMTAALGLFGAPTINVTMGRVLGGSSVLTGGVCFRVPDAVLRTWSRDMALADFTPERLDRYYRHVEEAIHVEEVPLEMRSRSTELFAQGCDALAVPIHPMSRNTKGCNGCGRCNFGCPHGAKLSVDLSYLPRAVAAGARLYTECLVERVTMRNGRAIGVEGHVRTGPIGARQGRLRVRAKRVVVACGGMHSPLLLRASGLAHVGSHIGRNLTLHPGFRLYARFDAPVRGWQGALQSAYVDAFEHEGVTLTSLFVPPSVIAATMPHAGPRHAALAEQVDHIAMFGALVHDDGGGSIHRNPFGREPITFYRCSERDQARIRFGIRKMADIFLAAGAREVFLPVLGSEGLSPDAYRALDLDRVPSARLEAASQHPLGTCRMSKHAGDGVVDPWGKVWDTEGLYVADGSILPSSLGVNPQLTIMMAATRIAWRIAEENLSREPLAA
jgi:choline dehydrogenase-like flavoprotein